MTEATHLFRPKACRKPAQGKRGTSAALGLESENDQMPQRGFARTDCRAPLGRGPDLLRESQGGFRVRRGLALGWLASGLWPAEAECAADFVTLADDHHVGIKLTRETASNGDISVYFGKGVTQQEQVIFANTIHAHLEGTCENALRLHLFRPKACRKPAQGKRGTSAAQGLETKNDQSPNGALQGRVAVPRWGVGLICRASPRAASA